MIFVVSSLGSAPPPAAFAGLQAVPPLATGQSARTMAPSPFRHGGSVAGATPHSRC